MTRPLTQHRARRSKHDAPAPRRRPVSRRDNLARRCFRGTGTEAPQTLILEQAQKDGQPRLHQPAVGGSVQRPGHAVDDGHRLVRQRAPEAGQPVDMEPASLQGRRRKHPIFAERRRRRGNAPHVARRFRAPGEEGILWQTAAEELGDSDDHDTTSRTMHLICCLSDGVYPLWVRAATGDWKTTNRIWLMLRDAHSRVWETRTWGITEASVD